MPRAPTVTADGTVEAIRSSETPFASTGDLADHFGVTRQAVRERRDLLGGDPRIKIGQIGNNTVFYLDGDGPEEDDTPPRAGDMSSDEVHRRSGEIIADDLGERERDSSETDGDDSVGAALLERLSQRSVYWSGMATMLIGVLLIGGAYLAFQSGQPLVAVIVFAAAVLVALTGWVISMVSAAATLAIEQPLRGSWTRLTMAGGEQHD